MTTTAVIPIKQLENAKQRLAGLLTPEERRLVFTAMVKDVLGVAEACVQIDQILVITNDAAVTELALGYGAEIHPEPEPSGLIEAVTCAGELLASQASRMLFLPGDVPLVTPEELETVLEGFGRSEAAEFLIVPARDLGGSNCIACSPPDAMQFGFGEDSFRRHLALARSLDIEPVVLKLPGLGLDIDTPDDLQELLSRARQEQWSNPCHTLSCLIEEGILDRTALIL